MAQREDILWEILRIIKGHNEDDGAYSVHQLKADLVLIYLPADIEDTINFMKYRDYLNLSLHGMGPIPLGKTFTLTEKAFAVYDNNALPKEEEDAFKESLWKIEPKLYGIGPNISGWKKLFYTLKKKFFHLEN